MRERALSKCSVHDSMETCVTLPVTQSALCIRRTLAQIQRTFLFFFFSTQKESAISFCMIVTIATEKVERSILTTSGFRVSYDP